MNQATSDLIGRLMAYSMLPGPAEHRSAMAAAAEALSALSQSRPREELGSEYAVGGTPSSTRAIDQFNEHTVGTDDGTALERLRFFCSLAMNGQDWLDVEPFFEAVERQLTPSAIEESEDSEGDWQCKDYADGWITFPTRKAAEKYQQQTGALMRYRRYYHAPNATDRTADHG